MVSLGDLRGEYNKLLSMSEDRFSILIDCANPSQIVFVTSKIDKIIDKSTQPNILIYQKVFVL